MGHKKADERETVIKWLEYCHKYQLKPWLWDFKRCYTNSLSEDSITAFLKYKNGGSQDTTRNGESKDTTRFCITGKKGSSADCDKEAIGLYQVLGWQNSATAITRGETMNSFLTTFKCALEQSSDYDTQSDKLGIKSGKKLPYSNLYDEKKNIKEQPYMAFDVVKNNRPAFQTFATLTHTIGNFTVLPHWMNTARYNFSKDYWDITLLSLQEWLNPTTPTSKAWINFVEMFYLQPYVNKDYQTELFWDKHSYGYDNLFPSNQDVPIFLKAVNERIEERGKYMIKQICDRLDLTHLNFYQEIKNMDRIKFSDEF